jgi:splicing factor 45
MLSLYANLLDPESSTAPGTISRAPVVFKQADADSPADDSAAKKQQLSSGRSHALVLLCI